MFGPTKIKILLIGLLVMVVLVVPVSVSAQVSALDPEQYNATKATILKLYSDQIQAYQQAYRRYNLAVAQYQKLGTLVALGELIDSSRESMLRRGEILLSYIDLLHLELRFASNVDLTQKRSLLTGLESLSKDLSSQQILIAKSQDHQAINARAASFIELVDQFDRLAFESKAVIFTSRLKTADITARNYYDQVTDGYQQTPETGFAAIDRQRAQDELGVALEKLDGYWKDAQELNDPKRKNPSQGWYTEYLTKLTLVQNQLIFFVNYLKEASSL